MKSRWRSIFLVLTFAGSTSMSFAGDPLPTEKVELRETIESTGPVLFGADGGRIFLADAASLKYLATMAYPTWRGQFVVPKDGKTAYLSSSYWERAARGTRNDVVEIWDVASASQVGEAIELPPRLAQLGSDSTMAALTADEQWLLLQNATPATSVSLVDLQAKKFVAEIPIPGCFGVYPAGNIPNRFFSLCGDGTVVSLSFDALGKASPIKRSTPIFNADDDPLFTYAQRDGDTLYFVSFNGSVYEIDTSAETAKLAQRYSIVEGVDGEWKPGGSAVTALVPDAKVLYVLMRPKSGNGDHREPSSEVWAVNVDTNKVISRSTVSAATGVTYAASPKPVLFMNDRDANELVRYAVDPNAAYTVRVDKTMTVGVGTRIEVR
jgi:methylamine dehydrogenase heavy chain